MYINVHSYDDIIIRKYTSIIFCTHYFILFLFYLTRPMVNMNASWQILILEHIMLRQGSYSNWCQIHNCTELIVKAAELDDDENPSSIEIRRRIVDMVEEMARDGVIWWWKKERMKEWSEIHASMKWISEWLVGNRISAFLKKGLRWKGQYISLVIIQY